MTVSTDNSSDNRKKTPVNKYLLVIGTLAFVGSLAAMGWVYNNYKDWTKVDATCEVVDFKYQPASTSQKRAGRKFQSSSQSGWVCKTRAEYVYNDKTYSMVFDDDSCEYKTAKECPVLVNSWYPWHSRRPVKYWIFWIVAAGGLILVIGGILKNKKA